MRVFVSALILMGLIIGIGIWTNLSIKDSTCQLSGHIDRIARDVRNESWDEALIKTRRLEKVWAEKSRWWPVLLDHQEMDNISFSLARLNEYVKYRDKSLAMGQVSELKRMVEHIPENQAVTLNNIF